MPVKFKVYLDPSVPSAYLDATKPQRQQDTQIFWNQITLYEVYISKAVTREIHQTPNPILRQQLVSLMAPLSVLDSDRSEVQTLAQAYIQRNIFPVRFELDAIHVATTTIFGLDALVSWNFHHLVKLSKKLAINATNLTLGYHPIEIVTPTML